MPEIDIDFCTNVRGGVLLYVTKKYCHEQAAHIIFFEHAGTPGRLRVVGVVVDALKLIPQHRGVKMALEDLPLDDTASYEIFSKGFSSGVFQFESSGMRDILRRYQPTRIEDLTALNALYRPGPLHGGMVDDFIDRKHGRKAIAYDLPELKPILEETYGVILYQEQVMQISNAIAGYSLGEADILRRAMGKKKAEEMAAQRDRFIKGALERGFPQKKVEKIFDLMEQFAGYGFNKSHSAAYAYLAYVTAYLKAHYPLDFMAALLTSETGNTAKVVKYINECRESIWTAPWRGQVRLLGEAHTAEHPEKPLPNVPDWLPKDKLTYEKEMLGFYVTGHPLDQYREKVKDLATHDTSNLEGLNKG